MLAMYLLRSHNKEPLHERIGGTGAPGLCMCSWSKNLGASKSIGFS